MPHLLHLMVDLTGDAAYHLKITGIDWAACLPSGMQRLQLPGVNLHHKLLQHLVQMPSLVDLQVSSLSLPGLPRSRRAEEFGIIQSDACAWKTLSLDGLPSFHVVQRFTLWPRLRLFVSNKITRWRLGAPSLDQDLAVAGAAVKLSTCNLNTFMISLSFDSVMTLGSPDTVLRALDLLAASICGVHLHHCRISARCLDVIAESLPSLKYLILADSAMEEEAWLRLLSLTSVTRITLKEASRVSAVHLTAFTSAVQRAVQISITEDCTTGADWMALKAWQSTLKTQREIMGWPAVSLILN